MFVEKSVKVILTNVLRLQSSSGSIMVWGGFSFVRVGELIKIDSKMNKNYYHRLL